MRPAGLRCKYMSQATFFKVSAKDSLCGTEEILKMGTPKISTATIRKNEYFYVIMRLKDADGMANSVGPNQTAK